MGSIVTARQVGQNVRTQRKQLGLTQYQLAKQTGVSERSVVSLELGDATGMRLDKLLSILSALGLTMSIQPEEDGATLTAPSSQQKLAEAPSAMPLPSGPILAFLQQAQHECPSNEPPNPSRQP